MGYYDDYLEHHGIKGMKWGVRRYQNADGTLTNAGRKRYGEDLDINDKSRHNIAKIRLGEARRRLDVAKANSKEKGENNYRIADLKKRERSAKKAVALSKKMDRGAKRVSRGETVTGNKTKAFLTNVGLTAASNLLASYLNHRINELGNQGRLTEGHVQVAKMINQYANMAVTGLSIANMANTARKNSDIRAYERARLSGNSTIKSIGSQEYQDVVKRRKEK